MDERHDPQSAAPDEGELLAAYLDAQTDEVTSARIERMLRDDPQAAARLDAIARTRARLQRLEAAPPPVGFRDRLDDRLRMERAGRAEARRAPVERRRAAHNRFAPLAAVAAVALVAVLGAAALLSGQGASSEDTAGGAAEMQAEAPRDAASAPLAEGGGADSAGEDLEDEAGAAESAQDGPQTAAGAAVPRADDADIARRLDRRAQRTQDPAARETELRSLAGLPTEPACLGDVAASAVDLVERDGELVLTALVGAGDGLRVVVFDPLTCERTLTFVH